MFPNKIADPFLAKSAVLCQDKNAVRYLDKNVLMYRVNNAQMFRGEAAKMYPDNSAEVFQNRSVRMFQGNNVGMFPDKYVPKQAMVARNLYHAFDKIIHHQLVINTSPVSLLPYQIYTLFILMSFCGLKHNLVN